MSIRKNGRSRNSKIQRRNARLNLTKHRLKVLLDINRETQQRVWELIADKASVQAMLSSSRAMYQDLLDNLPPHFILAPVKMQEDFKNITVLTKQAIDNARCLGPDYPPENIYQTIHTLAKFILRDASVEAQTRIEIHALYPESYGIVGYALTNELAQTMEPKVLAERMLEGFRDSLIEYFTKKKLGVQTHVTGKIKG